MNKLKFLHITYLFCLLSSICLGQDLNRLDSIKDFSLHGNLHAQLTSYSANGIQDRQEPLYWLINGNFTPTIYSIEIPISFIITEQERSYIQPFNQFGLSPSYKWIKLHLGYRNMNFSQYSLSGQTFLGIGIELKPNNFRIAAMQGRFQKAIEEDTSNYYSTPSYKRNGKALKIGYGTDNNFIDFIYLNGKDDTTSLNKRPEKFKINPSENSVLAFVIKKTFSKKLTLETDYGLSSIKYNIYTDDKAKDRYALKSSLTYRLKNVSLKFQFKRIEKDYKSLGASYISGDIQELTFAPSFSLLKQKLRVNLSAGSAMDNLNGTKGATTKRFVGSFIANYTPSKYYGLDLNYMNYSTGQESGRYYLNDSIKLSQTLSNFSITNRFFVYKPKTIHGLIVIFTQQNLNDQNRYTESFTENNSQQINLTYSLVPTQTPFTFSLSFMQTEISLTNADIKNNGITCSASRTLKKGQLNLKSSISYLNNSINGLKDGNTTNLMIGSSYLVEKKHTIECNINYLKNSTRTYNNSFSELRLIFGYNYRF